MNLCDASTLYYKNKLCSRHTERMNIGTWKIWGFSLKSRNHVDVMLKWRSLDFTSFTSPMSGSALIAHHYMLWLQFGGDAGLNSATTSGC